MERWKPCGRGYECSNLGRVRFGKRICRQWFERGHWFTWIGGKNRRVSRLVAAAFIGLRRGQWVKLKRGTSPRLSNLIVRGRGRRWTAKLSPAAVLAIYRSGASAGKLASKYRCSQSTIYSIQNGLRWAWLTRHNH